MDEEISQLKEYMDNSGNTVAITGSGISYLYGMGRLKQQTNRMDLMRRLSPQYVKSHPDRFYELMKSAFLDATFKLGPSLVHRQLAEFQKMGILHGIVTQNMDCLHTVAGSTNVVEIQGGFDDNICVDCEARYNDYTVWGHGEPPRCPACGAPLMPANFDRDSKTHDSDFAAGMERAAGMISRADLVIVIGTTGFLSEQYMSRYNPNTAPLVQINPSATRFDDMARLNIRGDAGEVFTEILSAK